MKNMKHVGLGIAFTATIALALLAGGGDAYAKNRSGGGGAILLPDITFTSDPTEPIMPLGITWE